jgi:hypothetical protein
VYRLKLQLLHRGHDHDHEKRGHCESRGSHGSHEIHENRLERLEKSHGHGRWG